MKNCKLYYVKIYSRATKHRTQYIESFEDILDNSFYKMDNYYNITKNLQYYYI